MHYFTFGSLLDRERMAELCPQAKPLFTATLPNYQLVFAGWSRQLRSSIATIKRAGKEKVKGVVYQVSEVEMQKLDRLEGYPSRSEKLKVLVFRDTGDSVEVFTHMLKNPGKETAPSGEYLAVIRKAYIDWGLV